LFLVSCVYSATTFSSGSDSVANAKDFSYRKIDKYFNGSTGGFLGYYSSVAVDGSGSSTAGTITANVVLMGVHIGYLVHPPLNWVGSIKGSATYSVNASLESSLTGSVGASLIITAFSHIVEKTPAGAEFRRVNLKDLLFTGTAGSDGKLSYASFKSTPLIPFFTPTEKVEIHYFVAEELGEVTFEGVTAIASPKTLESFIVISEWKYDKPENYLELVSGVATGTLSGTGTLTGTRSTLSSGVGENKVYAYFAEEAQIDGKTRKVVVKQTDIDVSVALNNQVFQAKLNAVYNGAYTAKLVYSSFQSQPGASKIIYDPTAGAGAAMQNGVSKVVFFAVAYVLALLI